MEDEPEPPPPVVPPNPIRVETALSRYPVHRLARRGTVDIDIRGVTPDGESSTRWEVDYSKKHGQPGPLAYKIDTLVVNRRIEESPRPIPKLIRLGSLRDLCRELGLSEGENVRSIRQALRQNAFAGITARTRYRKADGTEETLEADFTRYSVVFTGETLPDGRKADAVYVLLNDIFIQVINGATTRPLDYDYLRSLSPGPQRFYELLSYQMYAALKHGRPRARLVYSNLCAHAPQARHAGWERVRSQMNKLHRPHRESGYIAGVEFQQSSGPDGLPDWAMLYQPGPKARAEFRAFARRGGPAVLEMEPPDAGPDHDTSGSPGLEGELVRRGVTPSAAAELVRGHAEGKIRAQIERVDWACARKPSGVGDPAAYLVGAIRNDYAAPKDFVPKAERERRAAEAAGREREADEKRRGKKAADAAERAERQAARDYRAGLTPGELAACEAEALASTDPETRRAYESSADPRVRRMLLGSITDEHVRRLLASRRGPG